VKEIQIFEIADEMALPADVESCANRWLCQEIASNAGGRVFKTDTSRGIRLRGPGELKRATAQREKAVSACGRLVRARRRGVTYTISLTDREANIHPRM
jgi:hypothetical protein